MKPHRSEKLSKLNACAEAVKWASTQPSPAAAWKNCQRGDWMLWLLGRVRTGEPWSDERKTLVACAAECASMAGTCVRLNSLLAWVWCVDACERWARGEADRDEVIAARNAAAAAAYSAAAARGQRRYCAPAFPDRSGDFLTAPIYMPHTIINHQPRMEPDADDLACERKIVGMKATTIIKVCSCRRTFTAEQWAALPLVGIMHQTDGYPDLEGRQCHCGSSCWIEVTP